MGTKVWLPFITLLMFVTLITFYRHKHSAKNNDAIRVSGGSRLKSVVLIVRNWIALVPPIVLGFDVNYVDTLKKDIAAILS